MTNRNVSIELGDGDELLTVTLRGKPCLVADAQMHVVGFLKEYKRKVEAQIAAGGQIKPCGCQEKK